MELKVRIAEFPGSPVYVTLLIEGRDYQFAIIAVLTGVIEFAQYGQLFQSKARDICFIKSATIVRTMASEPVKLFIVQFSERFARENQYDVHASTINRLFSGDISKVTSDTDSFKVIKKLLLLLYKHHTNSTSSNSPVICRLTFNLLLSCFSEFKDVAIPLAQPVASYKAVTAVKFLRMVEAQATEQHGVRFYAAALCMTQGNLTRIIKEVTNAAPKSIIEDVLVQKAMAMLDDNLHTIYTVAEQLGFKSSSAFVNFFRFHAGSTPNEYRNRKSRHL
jgi:AraC-like DNA-binding protein